MATDDAYKAARKDLDAANAAYMAAPSINNLIAVYQAQNAVRVAANTAATTSIQSQPLNAKTIKATVEQLRNPNEGVPGEKVGLAQALMTQVRQAMSSGVTAEDSRRLMDAYNAADMYINQATSKMQDNDSQFADQYSAMTGQPAPKGQFNSAASINGTPSPQPGPGVPDEGVRPQMGPGVVPATTGQQGPPKRTRQTLKDRNEGGFNYDRRDGGIIVEPLPAYAPLDSRQDYESSGVDSQPGGTWAADADKVAQDAVRQSTQRGIIQSGSFYGSNTKALQSGRLVFTGYHVHNAKYIDDTNPRFGSQITSSKTPTYQSTDGLQYALGKAGFPSISEYQKAMKLPVTGTLDDDTMKYWQATVNQAAMNTASGYNTTVQMAIADQVKRMDMLLSQQRAAMAAAYNVDPTASAAVLGAAMKQTTGRLSTPGEDAEFHRAFNSANISTQGKVDAQQFARDWVRTKYPTEAGTQSGQDYYGAMYDVLTAGPGSLGSEAANING